MNNNLKDLPLDELRASWAKAWGLDPHSRIGRTMLEKSLAYKLIEQNGAGLNQAQAKHIEKLIKIYKANPNHFGTKDLNLKPGTQLVRIYKGKKHHVLITSAGYEYKEKNYRSLSQIAKEITGTHWNGLVFFGIKRK